MAVARSKLMEGRGDILIIRIPAQGIRAVRRGRVHGDLFSFKSERQLTLGTQLLIQYRVSGTKMWVMHRAVVLGCVVGSFPVVVQGRLVRAFPAGRDAPPGAGSESTSSSPA